VWIACVYLSIYIPLFALYQKTKWNDIVVSDDLIYEKKFSKTIKSIKKEDIKEIIAFDGWQDIYNNGRIGKEPRRCMAMYSPLCFLLILSKDADESIINWTQSCTVTFNQFAKKARQLSGVILIDFRHYGWKGFLITPNRKKIKKALTRSTYLAYSQFYKLAKHGYCISRSLQSYF
jgi:hypothetical protein